VNHKKVVLFRKSENIKRENALIFLPGFEELIKFYVCLLGERLNMIQKLAVAVLDGGKETGLVINPEASKHVFVFRQQGAEDQ
jgi:hypothetical protein